MPAGATPSGALTRTGLSRWPWSTTIFDASRPLDTPLLVLAALASWDLRVPKLPATRARHVAARERVKDVRRVRSRPAMASPCEHATTGGRVERQ